MHNITYRNVMDINDVIVEISHREIMPRWRNLADDEIREKTPGDPVTDSDVGCEHALMEFFSKRFPDIPIVGEEGVAAGTSCLDLLSGPGPCWVIDPLDGTWPFSKGMEGFGVLVAFRVEGEAVAGWLYDPVRRISAIGFHGQTWIKKGPASVPCPVSFRQIPDPRTAIIMDNYGESDVSHTARKRLPDLGYEETSHQSSAISATLDVLEGRSSFALISKAKVWDYSAPDVILRGAGGFSGPMDAPGWCYDDRGQMVLLTRYLRRYEEILSGLGVNPEVA